MHSYFANLYEVECVSQHYHRTLENISIWDISIAHKFVESCGAIIFIFEVLCGNEDILDIFLIRRP